MKTKKSEKTTNVKPDVETKTTIEGTTQTTTVNKVVFTEEPIVNKSSDNTFDNKFDQGITSNNKILQFLAGSPLGIWGIPVAIIIIGVIVYALFQ